MTAPAFITVEGIEGVGKSSQIATIVAWLEQREVDVVATREPGGAAVADRIRNLLLSTEEAAPDPETELLLIFAARVNHIRETINPALEAGHWVVSDRFTDATYAYQGGGRGLSDERIRTLEDWLPRRCRPDLTLLFDAPVDLALGRARRRSPADRFEKETAAFFERARAKYHERAQAEPGRFRILDASRSPADLSAAVEAELAEFWNGEP